MKNETSIKPLKPYDETVLTFIANLSKKLMKNSEIRSYPDVAAFAYWCRKSNLNRLSKEFSKKYRRVGRGIILHIPPSNVPINFAFSLIFGLLSGNINILRLPSNDHPQVKLICDELSNLIYQDEFKSISRLIYLIKYTKNTEITQKLSEKCEGRLIWGGDDTINEIKAMKTKPRCVDLCFADRYSICILDANSLIELSEKGLGRLVSGFYNDVFLYDQNACSSPHLILWHGKEAIIKKAQKIFWSELKNRLLSRFDLPQIHSVEKFTQLCRSAIHLNDMRLKVLQKDILYRIQLENIPKNIHQYRGKYGFFFEANDTEMANFKAVVDERYQTVTYFGIPAKEIVDKTIEFGLIGVDRVVPVGRALGMDVYWDGIDLSGALTRVISTE